MFSTFVHMNRYMIKLSYKGTNYHGWQIQPNATTVQGVVNKALSIILNSNIDTTGSGRTDTGVHAEVQVIHFDVANTLDDKFIYKLNGILPADIAVQEVKNVSTEFHARFDASSRAYQYRIKKIKDPFLQNSYYRFSYSLDVQLMNRAASTLLNYSNFESFSKVKTDVKTFDCTITEAYWEQLGDLLQFNIKANRFLRGMVRALVGTILDVGLKKITIEEFENIIKAKDRTKAGRAVPPEGLFLTEVNY